MEKLIFPFNLLRNEDEYNIKDDGNNVRYHAKETVALPTRQRYTLLDGSEKRIGSVEKMRNNFGLYNLPRYNISTQNADILVMKDIKQFHAVYDVEGEDIAINGDWLSRDFTIEKSGNTIAQVHDCMLDNKKGYEVDLLEPAHEELIACFMLAIIWIHNDEHYVLPDSSDSAAEERARG